MTASQTLLLELIRRALTCPTRNDDEPLPLPPSIEPVSAALWRDTAVLAESMEVGGLAFDALGTLVEGQRPEGELLMRWTAAVCAGERDYRRYRERCLQTLGQLAELRLPIVLMKGLAVARHYPVPEHRPIGDVDLYVGERFLQQVTDWFVAHGAETDPLPDDKHTLLRHNGLNWEIHFRSIYFYNQRSERRYRMYEAEETAEEELISERLSDGPAGTTVATKLFPPVLEMLYLTAHLQHHLILEEITLRHIVDWMMVLHHNRTALGIGEIQLQRQLDRLGLTRLYRAIGYIAIHHLGFDSNSYAFLTHFSDKEKERGEYLLRIILDRHIPGCRPYCPRVKEESTMIRLKHYHQLLLRCYHLIRLTPREALSAPIGFLVHAWRRRGKSNE